MTNKEILKKSFSITTTQSGLWALGIFLSSGFNLHWWYLLSWLKQAGLVDAVVDHFSRQSQAVMLVTFCVVFVICLVLFNIIKLWFFVKVHQSLHEENQVKCFLCQRVKQQWNLSKLIGRKIILWRTCLASLITVGLTSASLSIFNLYSNNSDYNVVKSGILLLCLVAVLVFISLWNMLVVLFLFWYELPFAKAASLAVDLLVSKFKKISSFTIILTLIFIVAVSIGSLVIWQIPMLTSKFPLFFSSIALVHTSKALISSIGVLLFLGWLIVNNLFFNVAMLVLFDSLVKIEKAVDFEGAEDIRHREAVVSAHSALFK